MTRDEMLARMTSKELSGWLCLYHVRADEAEDERDKRESGDGQVFRPPRDYETEDDDAETQQ